MIKQIQHLNLFLKDVRDVILSSLVSFFLFDFEFYSIRACGKSKSCSHSVCVECECVRWGCVM